MRRVTSESIVPAPTSTVHLVLDDFGRLGRAYREVDETHADADSLIECLLSGHYSDPARVIAFNLEEGWCVMCRRKWLARFLPASAAIACRTTYAGSSKGTSCTSHIEPT